MKEVLLDYDRLRYLSGGGHAVVLAVWLLAQPETPKGVYASLRNTEAGAGVSWDDFEHIYKQLIKFALIWSVSREKYIVTPNGMAVANTAVSISERDKRRLFFLNRARNFEVGA